MAFVLDASMMLAILLPDEDVASAELVRKIQDEGATVPAHWPVEVVNGCVMACRRQRWTEHDMAEALDDIRLMNIVPDGMFVSFSQTADLALKHKLTVYDAAYLELALRRRLPLATLDSRLSDAALAEGCRLL